MKYDDDVNEYDEIYPLTKENFHRYPVWFQEFSIDEGLVWGQESHSLTKETDLTLDMLYFFYNIKDPLTFVYPMDLSHEKVHNEEDAMSYFTDELTSPNLSVLLSYLNPYHGFKWGSKNRRAIKKFPHFFDEIIIFSDKWNIPFDPQLYLSYMSSLERYNPQWMRSDWSC